MAYKLLYTHRLDQLNPKGAELESVYLVRDIRQRTSLPLIPNKVQEHFSDFYFKDEDIDAMEQASLLIEPTLEMVKQLQASKDSLYEEINLVRTLQLLQAQIEPLRNNIQYAKEMKHFQVEFAARATAVLNCVNKAKGREEKIAANDELNRLFAKILRNVDFRFHFVDIVNEGRVSDLQGLNEGMMRGYLFHFTLEEELKKLSFDEVKLRIPAENFAEVEKIHKYIKIIKKGIDQAYERNMQMVNWAITLYAYVKMVMPL